MDDSDISLEQPPVPLSALADESKGSDEEGEAAASSADASDLNSSSPSTMDTNDASASSKMGVAAAAAAGTTDMEATEPLTATPDTRPTEPDAKGASAVQKSGPVLPKVLSSIAPSSWTHPKGYAPLGSPPILARPAPIITPKEPPAASSVTAPLLQIGTSRREPPGSDKLFTSNGPLHQYTTTPETWTSSHGEKAHEKTHESASDTVAGGGSAPAGDWSISELSLNPPVSAPLPTILEHGPSAATVVTDSSAVDSVDTATTKYELPLGSLSMLPEQRERIAHRDGVSFTLMVAGESGSGKSTFLQMLLGDCTRTPRQVSRLPGLSHVPHTGSVKPIDVHRTTEIEIHECVAEENGFEARFTIVDTPGFGDYTNNMYAWVPITNYIDSQYQRYMCGEEQPRRTQLKDTRVHVCVYFLQPTGHNLLPLDITAMKEIGSRVNLVLVIAKSDSFTASEITQFKHTVRACVAKHDIPVFAVDEEGPSWPYALVASTHVVRASDGREVLGRQYDWGTVEVDNPAHSDLPRLKQVLMGSQMLHLIDTTHEQHYKKQRRDLRLRRLSLALQNKASRGPGVQSPLFTPQFMAPKFSMFSPGEPAAPPHAPPPQTVEVKPAADKQPIEDVARRMTGLEILTAVSPFGYHFLEEQRIEEDLLYKQRVRGITNQFGVVLKFQLKRFEQEARELEKKDQQFRAELDELEAGNKLLEQRIAELEASTTRRRR